MFKARAMQDWNRLICEFCNFNCILRTDLDQLLLFVMDVSNFLFILFIHLFINLFIFYLVIAFSTF